MLDLPTRAIKRAENRHKKSLAASYSSILLCIVPSAMKGLTAEFGMGSGVPPSLLPPSKNACDKQAPEELVSLFLQDDA